MLVLSRLSVSVSVLSSSTRTLAAIIMNTLRHWIGGSGTTWFAVSLLVLISDVRAFGATVEFFDHAAFLAATNNLVVVDFDSIATETILAGTEFAGITINARRITTVDPRDTAPGLIVAENNVNTLPNGISASLFYSGLNSVSFDNLDDNFGIVLPQSSTAAGLWIGNVGASNNDTSTPTTVTFFDTSGGIVASEVFTQGHIGQIGSGANNRFFYGITTDSMIASISVQNSAGDGDGILLDDIQWAVTLQEVVGGSVTGMSPTTGTVTCQNLTQPRRKTVRITLPAGVESWNCNQAGLVVNSGDKIKQTITVTGPAN